jgi:type IX secretion system PorP/SprF family membrane protein
MNRVLILIVFLLLPVCILGQLSPLTNQYLLNPMSVNPAYAGSRLGLSASLLYRNQWTGMKGAPETATFSMDAPLKNERIGLGLLIVSDKIGVTKEKHLITNYAYRVDIGDGVLAFGLGAGIVITNTEWSKLEVVDEGDDFYLTDSKTFLIPSFRAGIYYSYRDFFAAFSVPKLLSYKFDYDKGKYVLENSSEENNYMLTTGGNFKLNQYINFMPSVLLSYIQGGSFNYDVNAQVNFKGKFSVGASYRSTKALEGIFQFQINNQLGIGYTYDFDMGTIGKYSNGSHQIMLRYEFSYKVNVINPLNF